eukprot:m.233791 g.233791  ORF g.233791 m.233791 type:complete len:140 (-) comp15249_c0_seq7:907-1326(-)
MSNVSEMQICCSMFVVQRVEAKDSFTFDCPMHCLNLASITAYYDEFDFLKVTQTLQNFITSELSSFYFEIAKDTLYLEPRASPQRLAMQTVLYELVNFVMHASAPIACHLSEVCCSSDSLRVSSATCFLTSIFRSNSTF